MKRVLPLLAALPLLGCYPQSHIRDYTPRRRNYEPGPYEEESRPVSGGSLWQDRSRGLFADFRASQVGDLVTIHVDENPRAIGDASTSMDRESSFNFGVGGMFGLMAALGSAYPDLDPTQLLNLMSSTQFDGAGNTRRGSNIEASIAVRVRRVLPNGDLFIEGTKVLMVNEEELHIYVSGVIRPQDIEPDNSVPSSRIADAEIEFTGRGDLTQNQRPGWLQQILEHVNPM
ncbi:MAG TPA: flagellar basal body L-ring protein FlgH [Sandaracinaceae bacterium LLY-WYZ-13_1]|nr:flagellar basal body L-ring protein FlgH [Sandaracinaceae bacterium LLY-WYZ-13_1]